MIEKVKSYRIQCEDCTEENLIHIPAPTMPNHKFMKCLESELSKINWSVSIKRRVAGKPSPEFIVLCPKHKDL